MFGKGVEDDPAGFGDGHGGFEIFLDEECFDAHFVWVVFENQVFYG
jgi:hypothetical protein